MLRLALGGIAVAAAVEGEMAGAGEAQRLGRRAFAAFTVPQQTQSGILHRTIASVLGPEATMLRRAHHRLVRLHVGG